MPPQTNTPLVVAGPALPVVDWHRSMPTCAHTVLDACATLATSTDDRIVHISEVLAALGGGNGIYPPNTVYKAIQRLTAMTDDNRYPTVLERVDRHRLRVP